VTDVRQMTKVWAVLALVGLVAMVAAACGGGEEPAPEGSPTPTPTAEEAALAPCRALQGLETYRYSVRLKLERPELEESPAEGQPTPTSTVTQDFTAPFLFEYNIDASFVAPDRLEMFISGSTSPFSMIFIGDQAWTEIAGRWQLTPQAQQTPYRPLVVCEAVLPDLDLSQAEPQEEKVNDVESFHYTFSQVSSPEAMAKIFGAGSDMDVLIKTLDVELWLAEKDKWPVRMEIDGSGLYADGRELQVHLVIDLTDANSGDIRVEPPL
jgi:hypothetical protein